MNFNIEDHTHFVTLAGSHSYGMDTPESDIDIRGWLIPPHEYRNSCYLNFDQYDVPYYIKDFPWKDQDQPRKMS